MLTHRQQAKVRDTFRQIAQGHGGGVAGLKAAGERGRWADVPLAAVYAADDVEMAVRATVTHDWGYEFKLMTIESWPGVLIVRRSDAGNVYEASARIGRFGDRQERADALLTAFDRQMRAFGRKPAFEVED